MSSTQTGSRAGILYYSLRAKIRPASDDNTHQVQYLMANHTVVGSLG